MATEVITLQDGTRAFVFHNLGAKHLITTNDQGCVKEVLFNEDDHKLKNSLREHFSNDQFFVINAQHGDQIILITAQEKEKIHNADGLFYIHDKSSQKSGAIISLTTGDCPHILLEAENRTHKIVGGIHSGWKGTSLNIAAKGIKTVAGAGFSLRSLKIGLWSGICKRCYIVDHKVRNKLSYYSSCFERIGEDQWRLNLAGVIKMQLQLIGINDMQISESGICSHCHKDKYEQHLLFSHRRKDIGRNGLFIMAE